MYIILSRKRNQLWISGIFKSQKASTEYFNKIEYISTIQNEIVVTDVDIYPFYIIEEMGINFRYFDKEKLIDYLLTFVKNDEHKKYGKIYNIYMVYKDFKPKIPGANFMEKLKYFRINENFIRDLIIKGVNNALG